MCGWNLPEVFRTNVHTGSLCRRDKMAARTKSQLLRADFVEHMDQVSCDEDRGKVMWSIWTHAGGS